MNIVIEHDQDGRITSVHRVQVEVSGAIQPLDGGTLLSFDLDERPELRSVTTSSHKVVDGELVERDASELDGGWAPVMPSLEPFQFWGAIRAIGQEHELRTWVADADDPVERAFLSATLDYARSFEWDHPFTRAVQDALEITDQELRDLWLWAASVIA